MHEGPEAWERFRKTMEAIMLYEKKHFRQNAKTIRLKRKRKAHLSSSAVSFHSTGASVGKEAICITPWM